MNRTSIFFDILRKGKTILKHFSSFRRENDKVYLKFHISYNVSYHILLLFCVLLSVCQVRLETTCVLTNFRTGHCGT